MSNTKTITDGDGFRVRHGSRWQDRSQTRKHTNEDVFSCLRPFGVARKVSKAKPHPLWVVCVLNAQIVGGATIRGRATTMVSVNFKKLNIL